MAQMRGSGLIEAFNSLSLSLWERGRCCTLRAQFSKLYGCRIVPSPRGRGTG